MGFSVKLAPGVRVRASSRGVRTSLGPRVARVHVGSGRAGVSTGVGPVGYYTSLSGGRTRSGSGSGSVNRQLATAARQQAAADKAAEAQRLQHALDAILQLHRAEFPESTRPVVGSPPEPDTGAILRRHRVEARRSTSVFDRSGRRAALAEADRRAAAEIAEIRVHLSQQEETYQAEWDRGWESLQRCEPDVVLEALAHAFEDNEAAAAAVGVEGTEVSLLVVIPPVSAIPERKPGTTPAGNLSLKKLTKRETADFYKLLVCGHMLVTVKEAFAVVPNLTAASVVAVRPSELDAYGNQAPEVIAAARCERDRLAGVRWGEADAVRIFNDCFEDKAINQRGVTKQFAPVDLTDHPDLRELLDAVDLDDLIE